MGYQGLSRRPINTDLLVAGGFLEDCDDLVRRCLQTETLNFQVFCNIWKDMNFADIFLGRNSGADVAELSEEVLFIAKGYLFGDATNFEIQVAGLFLVYGLANLQPYESFAKLRLTPADVPQLHRLADAARAAQRLDVLYVLGAVMTSPTTEYHIAEREHGLEKKLRIKFDVSTSTSAAAQCGVLSRGGLQQHGEELQLLRELAALDQRYHRAKEMIHGDSSLDRTLSYVDRSLSTDLARTLEDVRNHKFSLDGPETENHGARVESIKSRAMKETVNQMKHLVSVQDRKQITPQSSPTKPKTKPLRGKVKTGSPSKPMPINKRSATRQQQPNKMAAKKTKLNRDKMASNSSTEDHVTVDQLMNRAIGDSTNVLPILIKKDDGNYIEIEMIDDDNVDTQTDMPPDTEEVELIIPDRIDSDSDSDPLSSTQTNENIYLKGKNFRDVKKRGTRSKLSRLGILDVAGVKEPEK